MVRPSGAHGASQVADGDLTAGNLREELGGRGHIEDIKGCLLLGEDASEFVSIFHRVIWLQNVNF